MSEDLENQLTQFFNKRIPSVPEARKDLKMFDQVIQFRIKNMGSFVLKTASGEISFAKGEVKKANFSIDTSAETLRKIMENQLSLSEAWMQGGFRPKGLEVGHFSNPPVFPWLIRLMRCGLGRELPPK